MKLSFKVEFLGKSLYAFVILTNTVFCHNNSIKTLLGVPGSSLVAQLVKNPPAMQETLV